MKRAEKARQGGKFIRRNLTRNQAAWLQKVTSFRRLVTISHNQTFHHENNNV